MMSLLQMGPIGPELFIVFLIAGIFSVLPLVVSVFVYRDAKGRNSSHALAWALGAFFGSLVVWILYYIVRDEIGSGEAPRRSGV